MERVSPAVPQCRNIIPIYGFLPSPALPSSFSETVSVSGGPRSEGVLLFCSLDTSGPDLFGWLDIQGELFMATAVDMVEQ